MAKKLKVRANQYLTDEETRALEHGLILETVRATERAAIAAYQFSGKGFSSSVAQAGADVMREALNKLNIDGRIVINQSDVSHSSNFLVGQQVGKAKLDSWRVDVALATVKGTDMAADLSNNAMVLLALSNEGGFFKAPDVLVRKLVVGPLSAGKVNITWPFDVILRTIAVNLERDIKDLTIAISRDDYNFHTIQRLREMGVRVKLLRGSDMLAAIDVAVSDANIHAVMGVGDAKEAVLAASALKCLGGEIQVMFDPRNDDEKEKLFEVDIDECTVYETDDLSLGRNIIFTATGITDGGLLRGVRLFKNEARTHTISMAYQNNVVRFLEGIHSLEKPTRVSVTV